jgi:hypothetical protein
MYTDTITVFNKRKTESGDMWYPCVISGVDLSVDRAANQEKTGLENADTANLHIRYRIMEGKIMIGEWQYYQPKAWEALPDVTDTVTFVDGVSFFIRGEYDETPILDDDIRGGLLDYLNRIMDDCYKITSVGGPYKLIPHFEIGGK